MTPRQVVLSAALLLAATASSAQTIQVDDLECVPLQPHNDEKGHAVVWATVTDDAPQTEVRLYFRRFGGHNTHFAPPAPKPTENGYRVPRIH